MLKLLDGREGRLPVLVELEQQLLAMHGQVDDRLAAIVAALAADDAVGLHVAEGLADGALGEVGAGGDLGHRLRAGAQRAQHRCVTRPVIDLHLVVVLFGAILHQFRHIAQQFAQAGLVFHAHGNAPLRLPAIYISANANSKTPPFNGPQPACATHPRRSEPRARG
ncbi:hypothetical protein D3C79_797760 [compost metagenome]